ncbi:hypothetical protein TREMEDRAFT_15540, partial [Tremella mesenterica DSM 1558]|uniref:uncharacterized protein n=1 Tax=Tremella mesenterica (strain ATCC 24925 / CBS 8224 / DSM 1558 / NBRC 9311 / NRRL Y-6157 / RJB 2259-6 / UBC 559-6) TaxID=578456 RepID=UPI0003F49310
MISPAPTYARVASLSQWSSLFSPQGAFRAPSDQGNTIEHLDLDIRFVPSSYEDIKQGEGIGPLVLPNVCILTLRGGEYCQDSDERMELLLEVLENVRPVEVRWLNAAQEANEQRTYSTVCVHPVIIAAGQRWAAEGVLRKLMVQGGFPCPNLSAPTPFSLTPATTPCPSPGPTRATFGSFTGLSGLSSLPALSTTKPKVIDEAKAHERAERKRLAEYSLKPRFDFAFASWGVEILEWSFEGRFTPTGIHTILSYLFKSLNKFLNDYPLPSLAIISPIPDGIIQDLVHLPEILDMSPEAQDWLHD